MRVRSLTRSSRRRWYWRATWRTRPLIARPHQAEGRGHDERLEPARLVIRRRDREFQRCARLVPHATVVARNDAEPVGAGPEIGIERLAPGADVLPLGIAAFEHDTEAVLLGRDEAERCVVDLQVSDEWGEPDAGPRVVGAAIGDELFDVHRRRYRVTRQVNGIHDGDAILSRQPDFPVGADRHMRRHGQ